MGALGIYFGTKNIYLAKTEKKTLKTSIQIPWQRIFAGATGLLEEKIPEEIKIATTIKAELAKNNIDIKETGIVLLGKELIIRTFYMPTVPQTK